MMRDVTRSTRLLVACGLLAAAGCASAPAAVAPPVVSIEQKLSWILELEDQRLLRIEPPPAPAAPVEAPRRGRQRAAPAAPVQTYPDLAALVADPDPRVRRRASLAIGRVGLKEGVPPLVAALADADADVRAQAAFALGLIGDLSASAPLTTALADVDPRVRGRAAEGLGLIGAKEAAPAIGAMAAEYGRLPAVTGMAPDDERWPAASAEADAFRLAVFALVRLRAYEPLAAAVLDRAGRPVTSWWPVAFALQRIADPRARGALTQLLRTPGKYTASFAARALGALKDPAAVDLLLPLLSPKGVPLEVSVSAVRAVGQLGDPRAAAPLVALLSDLSVHPNLRLEAVAALGAMRADEALPLVQDLMTDEWPAMRIAALRASAAIDQDSLLLVLSSLEPDRDWLVRAAFAETLATLPAEVAVPRLREMLEDQDRRVLPAVLRGLVRHKVPDAAAIVLPYLKAPDFALRAAAASLVGQLKPEGGAAALRDAYTFAQADAAYDARAALLGALAAYGPSESAELLKTALADKDWAIRLRAKQLLEQADPAADYRMAIRPAPRGAPAVAYDDPLLLSPPYSPHVFIDTPKGTIEFELNVLDAPQTARNFITLARKGFFNGLRIHRVVPNFVVQDGDSRGDGQGGPGYTIRDELNERPFVRGTVGMALAGPDTGGSQFYIMHSPAPHLDGRYTVFGQVVNGMEVVDRIQQGDLIDRVRVWDGSSW